MSDKNSGLEASILIVDIRNFTPNLRDSRVLRDGRKAFCRFLARFYDCCAQACLVACVSDQPKSLYMNSIGDGVLSVFLSPERHFLDAYLAGVILFNKLPRLCHEYNQRKRRRVPDVSFGIGIESGTVWQVTSSDTLVSNAPIIETYIGDCINVAARVESATKDHARTLMLVSEQVNWLLCKHLFGEDYRELMQQALNYSLPDNERKQLWNRMDKLNEHLLVTFISAHNLRGVSEPVPLFRVSPTLAALERPEFQALLRRLSLDETHSQKINQFIESSC